MFGNSVSCLNDRKSWSNASYEESNTINDRSSYSASHIDNNNLKSITTYDTISSSRNEENNMSFVIMMANYKGMACAADSRSTAGTDWFPTVESDNLTKVFKNDTMLVATFGPNRVNDDNIKIEEIINEIMIVSTNPFEFSENFRKRICDNKTYNFLIGWKNNIYEYKISSKEVKYCFKGKNYACINKGEFNDAIGIEFNYTYPSDILEDKCRKAVENAIELCKKAPYSYVGGAIKSYHLSFDEDK